ncbi:uncharacterized protein LOC110847594 isoform X2 [Folsomia candida]|uniref:uncharacterized protein LOC110847594 isoform X2 n=1 Tax=Folsomia candida TaxID=158441 RepID=UPI000B8EFDAF|nr:uncharacterized protein LOC110847594 isoform X2 [Folsomia candida]
MEDSDNNRVGSREKGGSRWVKFNENEETENSETINGQDDHHHNHTSINVNPAVIEPTVEIQSPISSGTKSHPLPSSPSSNNTIHLHHAGNLQTIELHNSLENQTMPSGSSAETLSGTTSSTANGNRRNTSGFTNGDVIVSILPVNTKWPWITPASFRPELVPEELMAPGLTLTVEEYVHAMELLTSDVRFNAYTICYKRLLASWLSLAFFILLIILFSGVVGIHLFALGISWLIINAAAVFFCMYLKIKINQGLERCMARVNKMFLKHKLIVGLDDRGRISCHKVHLCFIYFDPNECVKRLEQVLEGSQDRQRMQSHLDAQDVEIVITGAQNTTRIPQKQKGERLFLRYVQRWGKDYLRRRLDWTTGEGGENPSSPRHLTSALCPCQYVEEYLRHKPVAQAENSSWSWWFPCFSQPHQAQAS